MVVLVIVKSNNEIATKLEDVTMIEVEGRKIRFVQPHCSGIAYEYRISDYRFQILPGYKEK